MLIRGGISMNNQQTNEKFYNTRWFLWILIVFAPYIGLILLIKNKPYSKKKNTILISYCCIITLILALSSYSENKNIDTTSTQATNIEASTVGSNDSVEEQKKKEEEQKKKEEENKLAEQLTFTGTMNLTSIEGKVVVIIDTNVPDGGLFEVTIVNSKLDSMSDFVTAQSGKVYKEFAIPKNWGVGYISSLAMFRFNLSDHPQPENIKAMYGQNGEKMLGKQAVEHNAGGKNGNIEVKTIAYPNEDAIKEEQAKLFSKTLKEIVKASEGVILSINPRGNDWSMVDVVLSDSWYYSMDHEKERFAEQVQQLIETSVKNCGIISQNSYVSVYYYDNYNKRLAEPKILGGYKILK